MRACENWTETNIVNAALSLSKVKTNGVKEKILIAINTILDKLQDKILVSKQKEKIVSFLSTGMNEAALEVRNAAKSGFLILKNWLSESDFEKLVLKSTSDRDYAKVIEFIGKESTTTDKFSITNGISTKGTFYYNKTRMSKMSKQPTDKGEFGDLESTVQSFKADSSKIIKTPLMKKESSSSSGYGKQSNFELINPELMDRFNDIVKLFDDNDWK